MSEETTSVAEQKKPRAPRKKSVYGRVSVMAYDADTKSFTKVDTQPPEKLKHKDQLVNWVKKNLPAGHYGIYRAVAQISMEAETVINMKVTVA